MSELYLMQQLLSVAEVVWVSVVYLAGLFVALLFRPDRIRHVGLFRIACLLFALAVIVPPVLSFCLQYFTESATRGQRGGMTDVPLPYLLRTLSRPCLLGTSMICALIALLPPSARRPAAGPARHPLED